MSTLGEKISIPKFISDYNKNNNTNTNQKSFVFGKMNENRGGNGKEKAKEIDEGFFITKEDIYTDKPLPDPSFKEKQPYLARQLNEFIQQMEEYNANRDRELEQTRARESGAGAQLSSEEQMQCANVVKIVQKNIKICLKKSIMMVLNHKEAFDYEGGLRVRINFIVFPGNISEGLLTKIRAKVNEHFVGEPTMTSTKFYTGVLDITKTDHINGYMHIFVPFQSEYAQNMIHECIE